jgi:hypothetical protein
MAPVRVALVEQSSHLMLLYALAPMAMYHYISFQALKVLTETVL